MKLAEALQERADLNRRIEQLNSRLYRNSKVQQGRNPEEDPAELFLYVDENRYPCDAASLSCQVSDIDRGAHQLRTELVSKSGKILASSGTVTVSLFRVIAVR